MAIYKPSNCQPFLNSIDLTTDQYLQCEVNTSNMKVTGYKLRVTSSSLSKGADNLIFEGAKYTPIPFNGVDNNTGLNGSIFAVKFITTIPSEAVGNPNIIYYNNNTKVWYKDVQLNSDGTFKTGNAVNNLLNGYQNQPYRWQITFAQGQTIAELESEVQHPAVKWYDMIITNGLVMGSTGDRIQTYPSKEIKNDYYVLLYDQNGNPLKGLGRQLILRKDASFGYIYPQEGKITNEQMQQAAYYEVFQDTDNLEAISPNRVVDYMVTIPSNSDSIVEGWVSLIASQIDRAVDSNDASADIANVKWTISNLETKSSVNSYYIQQTMSIASEHKIVLKENASGAKPLLNMYAAGGGYGETQVINPGVESLLFTAEKFSGEGYPWENYPAYSGDNFNGIYEFVSATWENVPKGNNVNPSGDIQLLIRWQRPSNARNIAAFMNGKQWFINNGPSGIGNRNFGLVEDLPAGAGTEINKVALSFAPEKPVELYTAEEAIKKGYDKSQTKGRIFKNEAMATSDGYKYKTYIRPFTGLQSGMGFQYYTKDNKLVQITNFTLSPEEEEGFNPWYITYTSSDNQNPLVTLDNTVLTPDEISYKIISYFKTSDENPFYAYSEPTVLVEFAPRIRAMYYLKDNIQTLVPELYEGIPARGEYLWDTETDDSGKITVLQNGVLPPEREHYPWTVPFRFVELKASYTQSQNKSWKNFTWSLYDYNLNTTRTLETQYSGDITASFDGLQNGHRYIVTLTLEDELNAVLEKTVDFQCVLPENLNEGYFPLEVGFDCATQSVDINFIKNGIVVPNYYYNTQNELVQNIEALTPLEEGRGMVISDGPHYKNAKEFRVQSGDVTIPKTFPYEVKTEETGDNYSDYMVQQEPSDAQGVLPFGAQYAYTKLPVQQQGSTQEDPIGPLSGPQSNSVTFNSQHKLNTRFVGNIFDYQIDLYPEETYFDTKVGLRVGLGASVVQEGEEIVVDTSRNKFRGNYIQIETTDGWQTQQFKPVAITVQVYGVPNSSSEGLPNQWRQGNPIVWAYLPVNASASSGYDYLPTTIPYDLIEIDGEIITSTNLKGADVFIEDEQGLPTRHLRWTNLHYLPYTQTNSTGEMKLPLGNTSPTNQTSVWWDIPLAVVTMANGQSINVKDSSKETWVWDDAQTWEDNRGVADLILLYDVNAETNHTGRQEIGKAWLLFNSVMKNFDPKERLASENIVITIQCYMKAHNINEI